MRLCRGKIAIRHSDEYSGAKSGRLGMHDEGFQAGARVVNPPRGNACGFSRRKPARIGLSAADMVGRGNARVFVGTFVGQWVDCRLGTRYVIPIFAQLTVLPISHIMSTKVLHIATDESSVRPPPTDSPAALYCLVREVLMSAVRCRHARRGRFCESLIGSRSTR